MTINLLVVITLIIWGIHIFQKFIKVHKFKWNMWIRNHFSIDLSQTKVIE